MLGPCLGIFLNLFIHPLAELLGSTPQIHGEAVEYIRYIVSFSPFLIFSFLLSGLVRNDGSPKLAMFALAFGSVSNIVLDYVFMCPLNLGIGGAALATAIGPVFSVLILLPHFLLKKGSLYFAVPRLQFPTVRNIFTLGFPSFIIEYSACLHEPTPQELLDRMELFIHLWNALNSLPEVQGIRVEAHLILGKSYRQIAQKQGVDKSAVRHSVKSGKAAMRKYLKKFL